MADAVLAGQDERVGEELLADGADQLPLDVLDRDLAAEDFITNSVSTIKNMLKTLGLLPLGMLS